MGLNQQCKKSIENIEVMYVIDFDHINVNKIPLDVVGWLIRGYPFLYPGPDLYLPYLVV